MGRPVFTLGIKRWLGKSWKCLLVCGLVWLELCSAGRIRLEKPRPFESKERHSESKDGLSGQDGARHIFSFAGGFAFLFRIDCLGVPHERIVVGVAVTSLLQKLHVRLQRFWAFHATSF